jgi:nucleoside-diphosphate-sugar epimerase
VEVIALDITRAEDVERHMRPFDRVFHVAATYRKEPTDPDEFRRVNVDATEHLLRLAAERGVGRFVHCSTVGIHGPIDDPPADEGYRPNPNDAYQRSKWEGEQRAHRYFADGLPGTVVRPTAIYGPEDGRFLKLFRAIERGVFVMIGSGETLYHMVHVDDLVQGFLLASEREEALGEAFIVGGARPCTLRELVDGIAEVLGVRPSRLRVPLLPVQAAAVACETLCRPLGVSPPLYPRRVEFFSMDRAFRIDKARKLLGFAPQVELAHGLADTARGYREAGWLGAAASG